MGIDNQWILQGIRKMLSHKNNVYYLSFLCRMLRTNEDIEVKSVGLTLQDMKTEEKKKLSPACCN